MFGIKKLKERIENLEMENVVLKANVEMLLDVCKPQIDKKVKEKIEELTSDIKNMFDVLFNTKNKNETKTTNIKKEKVETKVENTKETEPVEIRWHKFGEKENNNTPVKPKKYDKNGIKYKDVRYSSLMQYYTKYNLNLEIRGFKPMKRMGEKEAATLLYLFDKYKYVDEIKKHIGLSKTTIITYAYELRKNGYLIYDNEIGRVANGCLIYKGV